MQVQKRGAEVDGSYDGTRDVVVVGASAGGVGSLREFVARLDPTLPAAVLVVLHLPPSGPSMLASILDKSGPLPVVTAADRDALEHGRIVVAPPDHHLVVTDAHSTITRGPHENGTRPAVDVLFRSAARACGPRVVGVILSGALDDGTAGMEAIRQRGGAVLAQSPDDAAYPSMPSSVIQNVGADMIGTAAELADMVNDLARTPARTEAQSTPSRLLTREVQIADMQLGVFDDPDRPGQAAGFSCPDCNGSLFQIHDGDLVRFRCRVGHAWSSLALMAAQSESLDSALWMALRSLEDKAALSDQLADRAAERGNTLSRQRFLEKAAEARRSARVLQRLLEQPLSTPLAEEATKEEHVHRP